MAPSLFLSLPSASCLVPFKICYYPKVTRAWSCQASSTAEEILESLWAEVDGS